MSVQLFFIFEHEGFGVGFAMYVHVPTDAPTLLPSIPGE